MSVAFTHQVGEGRHSAIIKAIKPTDAAATTTTTPGQPDHPADGLRLRLLLGRPAVERAGPLLPAASRPTAHLSG